jgi:hypothetical protein
MKRGHPRDRRKKACVMNVITSQRMTRIAGATRSCEETEKDTL